MTQHEILEELISQASGHSIDATRLALKKARICLPAFDAEFNFAVSTAERESVTARLTRKMPEILRQLSAGYIELKAACGPKYSAGKAH